MQIIIFPSCGSNRGPLTCQANVLTTVPLRGCIRHYRLVLYTYDYYRRFNYILARWLTSSRPTKTFLSHINQIRIHCLYQKIHVFYLIPNFSLQLYSFYGCIAHFVSDLVLNPEYRFSRVVAHIKPY